MPAAVVAARTVMHIDELRELLDQPALAEGRLTKWGLEDPRRGHADLTSMAAAGLTLDLLEIICGQLAEHLPRVSDPDRALNNLDRFVQAARNPLALGSLFERDCWRADPAANLFHQPALERLADPGSGELRSAAHHRRPAGSAGHAG